MNIHKQIFLIFLLFLSMGYYIVASEQPNNIANSNNLTTTKSSINPKKLAMRAYNYIANLDKYSFSATILNEDNLDDKMVIYLTHYYKVSVSRPDKIRMDVRGDVDNQNSYFNKGRVSIFDIDENIYATVNVSKNIDDALDELIDNYGIDIPLTQLIYSNKQELVSDLNQGYYIGVSKIDGIDCHYIAFSGDEWDIHLWIATSDKPLIKRMIFLDKKSKWQPRSIITIKWDISSDIDDKIFDFKAPKGAIKAKIIPIDKAKQLKIEDTNPHKDI